MTDLTPLIDRVRSGEGPDRELDGDIAEALGMPPPKYFRTFESKRIARWWDSATGLVPWTAPALTSDLNAVVALIDDAGWQYTLCGGGKRLANATVQIEMDTMDFQLAEEDGKTAVRALLAAFLSSWADSHAEAQGEKP